MGLIAFFRRAKWLLVVSASVFVLGLLIAYGLLLNRPDIEIPLAFNGDIYKQVPVAERCVDMFYDFESETGHHIKQVKQTGSGSPSNVFAFTDSLEFGPTYATKIKSICEGTRLSKLIFTCDAFASRSDLPAPLVVSIEHEGKSLYWKATNLPFAKAKWDSLRMEFDLPEEVVNPEAELKIYVWNNSRNEFMIDNMRIGFFSDGGKIISYGFYPERYVEYDFDDEILEGITKNRSDVPSLSGRGSCKLGFFQPFSPVVTRRVEAVSDGSLTYVMARAMIHPTFDDPSLSFAISLADSAGVEYYFESRANDREHKAGEWTPLKAKIDLPHEQIKPSDIISIYVWNRGFQNVYVDDFVVQFGESNKRVGHKPIIDMQGYGEKGYDFKVNEPPFRTQSLAGIAVSNISNLPPALTKEFTANPIHAFDNICVGRFVAGQSQRSQLALFRRDHIYFFDYCQTTSSLRTCAVAPTSIIKGLDFNGLTCLAADLDGDGSDEVVVHQPGNKRFHVVQPDRSVPFASCVNVSMVSSKQPVISRDVSLIGNLDHASLKLFAVGDFIGGDSTELLFVNTRNGNFALVDINGKLNLKGQSQDFIADQSDGFLIRPLPFFAENKKSALAIRENERSEFGYFIFDVSRSTLIKQLLPGSELLVYAGCDDITMDTGLNSSIWYFHRSVPRFGMYQSRYSTDFGLRVEYDLDFSVNDGKPKAKYYESRRLLYGDFTGSDSVELLLISSNCDDKHYRGYTCQRPKLSGEFVPVIQLFKLK